MDPYSLETVPGSNSHSRLSMPFCSQHVPKPDALAKGFALTARYHSLSNSQFLDHPLAHGDRTTLFARLEANSEIARAVNSLPDLKHARAFLPLRPVLSVASG